MKKKLSVLLIGSLVAISLAGCSGSTTVPESTAVPEGSTTESSVQTSEASQSSQTSSDASKTETSQKTSSESSKNEESASEDVQTSEEEDFGPEEGDIVVDEHGNEYVYHEDGSMSPVGDNSETGMEPTPDEPEQSTVQTKYLDVTYTPINGKDANMDTSSIDMSKPVYYTVASSQELKDFVDKYGKQYSLNDVESGVTFSALAEKFDDTYFDGMSLIIIPAVYDKDTESEIGTITLEGDNYNIEVCTQTPSSDAQADYLCFVVQADKSDLDGKQIVLNVITDSMISDEEEDI